MSISGRHQARRFTLVYPLLLLGGTAAVVFFGFYLIDWIVQGQTGNILTKLFTFDIETLQNLEEALEEFAGCGVVISHDRWFLDRLCTHILAFEGDSHVDGFEGNFEAYEEDK